MSHREAKLKSALFQRVKEDEPSFLVLQLATAGAPDREVVGNGRVSHWEGKHGTPRFVSHGNQELMCQRLEIQGYCRYILWLEDAYGDSKRTLIVQPRYIRHVIAQLPHFQDITCEASATGHSHAFVSDFIRKVHRGHHCQ